MGILLFGVAGAITLVCLWFAAVYVVPVVNNGFSCIWEDPIQKQRKEGILRLKELHINGEVPEETAVLMAAKELNTTEEELLKVLGTFSARDLRGVITGKKSGLDVVMSRVDRALKRRD